MSRDRLAVLAIADYSAGNILTVGNSGGSLVVVGVVSLHTGKPTVHKRFSVAAVYEPGTQHLFSVRSVGGNMTNTGFRRWPWSRNA